MREWLIRKTDNTILGPYSVDQIRLFIQDKRLHANDEVCPGDGYWFSLIEREEVLRNLGIESPKLLTSEDDEDTQTDTKVLLESGAMPALDFDAVKDEASATRVFVQKGGRGGQTQKKASSGQTHAPRRHSFLPRPIVLSDKIERFSALKFLAFILGGIAVGILLSLLQRFL